MLCAGLQPLIRGLSLSLSFPSVVAAGLGPKDAGEQVSGGMTDYQKQRAITNNIIAN